jgi:hypothetical protein
VQGYLILVCMFLLVAAPSAVIWLRSGGKLSLASSFHLVGLNILRFWGIAFAAVAGLMLIVTISDQIGLSHFGHPAYSLPFEVIFTLAGFRLWHFASSQLRATKSRDSAPLGLRE